MSSTGLLRAALESQHLASIAERPAEEDHFERSVAYNGTPALEGEIDYIARMHDVADGLDSLCRSVASLESTDASHLMLVETCLNLAQAGTTERAEDIQPGLESFLGQKLSLESSVQRRILDIIQAIGRALQRVWKAFMAFLDRLFSDAGMLKFQLETVQVRCRQHNNASPKKEHIRLGQSVYSLVVNRLVPQDAVPILRALSELRIELCSIREHYVPKVIELAKAAEPLLAPPQDPAQDHLQWIASLNEVARLYNVAYFRQIIGHTSPMTDGTYPPGSAFGGTNLPGSRRLVVLDGAKLYPEKVEGGVLEQATVLQSHSVKLVHSHTSAPYLDQATMPTLGTDHIAEIAQEIEHLIAEIDEARKMQPELTALSTRLQHTLELWERVEYANLTELQVGLRYATVFSSRLTHPYIQLLGHTSLVCQAALSFCRTHLAAYR